jgi:hypothetical protein
MHVRQNLRTLGLQHSPSMEGWHTVLSMSNLAASLLGRELLRRSPSIFLATTLADTR